MIEASLYKEPASKRKRDQKLLAKENEKVTLLSKRNQRSS
jgi:hypothetical protein